jgi:tripartite-type tricarboxylate transporter receptor subunit TctC
MKASHRQAAKPQHPSKPRRNNRPRPKIPSSGQHSRRRFLRVAAGAVAFPGVSGTARAQAYPTRPITMVVTFPAGAANDAVGRILAERMRSSLGQPIVIENVTGADGSIGTGRAARAKADGYTIVLGGLDTHVINGALYSLQYDVLKDFAPILPLVRSSQILMGRKTMAGADVRELIGWLKANPNKASVGITTGYGRLLMTLFQKETATRLAFVPYRGGAPAMQDLVAGHIDLAFALPFQLPLVRAGSIKAYAVMSDARITLALDIPTFTEKGMPALSSSAWYGLFAPKGTPNSIIAKLDAAAAEALADPAVRSRLVDFGYEVFPRERQTPEALGALQKADIEKWWPIIKELGINAQ